MSDERRSWKDIASELAKEKDPQQRRYLERELVSALERAGFRKFSGRPASPDIQTDDTEDS